MPLVKGVRGVNSPNESIKPAFCSSHASITASIKKTCVQCRNEKVRCAYVSQKCLCVIQTIYHSSFVADSLFGKPLWANRVTFPEPEKISTKLRQRTISGWTQPEFICKGVTPAGLPLAYTCVGDREIFVDQTHDVNWTFHSCNLKLCFAWVNLTLDFRDNRVWEYSWMACHPFWYLKGNQGQRVTRSSVM